MQAKTSASLLFVALLLFIPFQAQAQEAQRVADDERDRAQRFLILSGLNGALQAQAELAVAPLGQIFQVLEQSEAERFSESLNEIYDQQELRFDVLDAVEEHFADEEKIRELNAWLNSRQGQAIVRHELEVNAASDEEVQEFFDTFNPQSPEAQDQIQKAQTIATMFSDHPDLRSSFERHIHALAEAVRQEREEDEPIEGLDQAVNQAWQERMRINTLMRLVAYRDADSELMDAYLEFLESDLGETYRELYAEVQNALLNSATERLLEKYPEVDGTDA